MMKPIKVRHGGNIVQELVRVTNELVDYTAGLEVRGGGEFSVNSYGIGKTISAVPQSRGIGNGQFHPWQVVIERDKTVYVNTGSLFLGPNIARKEYKIGGVSLDLSAYSGYIYIYAMAWKTSTDGLLGTGVKITQTSINFYDSYDGVLSIPIAVIRNDGFGFTVTQIERDNVYYYQMGKRLRFLSDYPLMSLTHDLNDNTDIFISSERIYTWGITINSNAIQYLCKRIVSGGVSGINPTIPTGLKLSTHSITFYVEQTKSGGIYNYNIIAGAYTSNNAFALINSVRYLEITQPNIIFLEV